jgi:hypothetical protein
MWPFPVCRCIKGALRIALVFLSHLIASQQGQERLLWASAQAETASGAGSAEADSSQRGGAAGYSACPPQMHLRGTDLMFNCDTVLSGDICFTASHVVGRGLRNKGPPQPCIRLSCIFPHASFAVPAFSLCFNSFFAPDAWGWRCESSDEQSQSLSREFFRSKVVFQLRQLDISPAVIDRFPKGETLLETSLFVQRVSHVDLRICQVFLFRSMSFRN